MSKIVRSLCYFSAAPDGRVGERLAHLAEKVGAAGFTVQTRRIATSARNPKALEASVPDSDILLAMGGLRPAAARAILGDFCETERVSFSMDLTGVPVDADAVGFFRDMLALRAEKTFQFAYAFNNPAGSPYFPAAQYGRDGFAIGLQPTDLAEGCETFVGWLGAMALAWAEVVALFSGEPDFLGIDSSTAPLGAGPGSLVGHLRRWFGSWEALPLTDVFTQLTHFLKTANPRPTGLCGLMLPCLEDFGLAAEYERGRFSVERNLFLSLHSGLGIDTYPIGVNEDPETLLGILKLTQALSAKYAKPLSARFVSDGKARVGERTSYGNQYLKDVVILPLAFKGSS